MAKGGGERESDRIRHHCARPGRFGARGRRLRAGSPAARLFCGTRTRRSRAPLVDLTCIVLGQGRPAEALALARSLRDIDLVDSLAATRTADVGLADLFLARAYVGLGRQDSALTYAPAALAALTAGAGPASPATRDASLLLASLAR
jgi:hypothetical protein